MTHKERLRQEYEQLRAEAIDACQQVAACRFTARGELRNSFCGLLRANENMIRSLDTLRDMDIL